MRRTDRVIGIVVLTLAWTGGPVSDTIAREAHPAVAQTSTPVSQGAGMYSKEQAGRGSAVYEANCARCHLENLKGNDMAPALMGDSFLAGWENKSARALYSLILSTMPSDNPGTLAGGDVLDIVAFVLQTNGFAAGSDDLTLDRADKLVIKRLK
jgi:cytochrome c